MAGPLWFVIKVATPGQSFNFADVVGPFPTAAAFQQQYPGAGTVGNASGYPTRAAAQAAADAYNHLPRSKRQPGAPSPQEAPMVPGLTSPLAGIDEVGAVLKGFFTTITDAGMWRCVFLIALGAGLIAAAVRLWLGKPLFPQAPSVVPVPV